MVKKHPKVSFGSTHGKFSRLNCHLSPLSLLSRTAGSELVIPAGIFWGKTTPDSLSLYKRLTRFKRYPLYIVRSEQSS